MAKVLLIDNGRNLISAISAGLWLHGHRARIMTTTEEAVAMVRNGEDDVVVVDVSTDLLSDWHLLDQILGADKKDPLRPVVLCLCSSREPRIRLKAERKGARVLWV
jgi:CheY-like chemotaxis protein